MAISAPRSPGSRIAEGSSPGKDQNNARGPRGRGGGAKRTQLPVWIGLGTMGLARAGGAARCGVAAAAAAPGRCTRRAGAAVQRFATGQRPPSVSGSSSCQGAQQRDGSNGPLDPIRPLRRGQPPGARRPPSPPPPTPPAALPAAPAAPQIRDRIGSVKNTMKITEAMKLVAAAKVRRAQAAVINGRPFSENLIKVRSGRPCGWLGRGGGA